MTLRNKWHISRALTVVLLFALISLWGRLNDYDPHAIEVDDSNRPVATKQLRNMKDVNDHLDANWELTKPKESQTIQIPTGIFIQSLKFISSSEVNITGYIWQRYSADLECNVVLLQTEWVKVRP